MHPKSSNIFHTEIFSQPFFFFSHVFASLHAIPARATAFHYLGFNFNIERVNSPILQSVFSFNSRYPEAPGTRESRKWNFIDSTSCVPCNIKVNLVDCQISIPPTTFFAFTPSSLLFLGNFSGAGIYLFSSSSDLSIYLSI
ncbi:hypothetical protein CEXT_318511 [Caerostris extrusa]|uniref:Uncharacterized protein n=1 Tax=Caerostris extrusa TaxID=172846 RepID=A0AAV4MBK3_CAEEX|nr:hypothetical protein CEXT_318511 [Caerostris extrusa]